VEASLWFTRLVAEPWGSPSAAKVLCSLALGASRSQGECNLLSMRKRE